MLITEETQAIVNSSFPLEVNVMSCIVYSVQSYISIYALCGSPEAGSKPRHIPLRQSRPYQPRTCFHFRLAIRVDLFLRWPALKRFRSTHRFQLRKKYWARTCTAVAYTTRHRKSWKLLFALGVVVDVCWLFFSFEVDYFFAHTCYLLRGIRVFAKIGF